MMNKLIGSIDVAKLDKGDLENLGHFIADKNVIITKNMSGALTNMTSILFFLFFSGYTKTSRRRCTSS